MDDMDIIEQELKKIDEQDKYIPQSDIIKEVCPVCGEPGLMYYRMTAGGIFFATTAEQKYQCKNCGYIGSVSIEIKSAEDIIKIKENYELTKLQALNQESGEPLDQKPVLINYKYSWLWKIILMITVIYFLFFLSAIINRAAYYF